MFSVYRSSTAVAPHSAALLLTTAAPTHRMHMRGYIRWRSVPDREDSEHTLMKAFVKPSASKERFFSEAGMSFSSLAVLV